MPAFISALLAVIGISYVASVALESYQRTVDASHVGSGARPDPEPKLRDGPPAPKS